MLHLLVTWPDQGENSGHFVSMFVFYALQLSAFSHFSCLFCKSSQHFFWHLFIKRFLTQDNRSKMLECMKSFWYDMTSKWHLGISIIGCCTQKISFVVFNEYALRKRKNEGEKSRLNNFLKGGKFLKKLWCCVGGEYCKIIWFYSTGLIMWIGHRKEIRKLTFRAVAFRRSESRNCGLRFGRHIYSPIVQFRIRHEAE